MTGKQFKSLDVGDIVRGRVSGVSYVVTGNYGGRVTAVRTAEITNPDEWELIVPHADDRDAYDATHVSPDVPG